MASQIDGGQAHSQTAHSSRKPRAGTPSRAGTPCPLPFPKRCKRGGGVPAGRGGPGSKGGRGPGSWYSSTYTESRSTGIPRAGSPQRAGTPRIFPKFALRGNGHRPDQSHFLMPPNPKDPAVLKTLRDSELLRRSVFTTPPPPYLLGKESIHRPAPVQKWGPQRKDFGGGYGFLGFYRVFVSTTGLESFSLRPEKFSKRFSFVGGCVRFFLLCIYYGVNPSLREEKVPAKQRKWRQHRGGVAIVNHCAIVKLLSGPKL